MSDTRPILCYSKIISSQPRESLRKKKATTAATAATADEEKKSRSLRLPSPKNSACASPMKFQTSSSAARKPSANSHFHQVQGACNILSTRALIVKSSPSTPTIPLYRLKKASHHPRNLTSPSLVSEPGILWILREPEIFHVLDFHFSASFSDRILFIPC